MDFEIFHKTIKPGVVVCRRSISRLMTQGKEYPVRDWVAHEFGNDPVIQCDNGQWYAMSSSFFYQED